MILKKTAINFCPKHTEYGIDSLTKEADMITFRYIFFFIFCFITTLPMVSFADELETSLLGSDPVYEVNAGIGIGFEYTDNKDDESTNQQSAFINHIYPTFSFKREGSRLSANLAYSGDYSIYLQDDIDPEFSHTLDASLTATVIENVFFVTASESMQQIYESLALNELEISADAGDERNQNVITLSPYFSLNPTERTNITFGYTFTDTRYSLGEASENASFLSFNDEQYDFSYNVNQAHNGYFSLNHELTDRASFRMGGAYTRTNYDDEDETDSTQYNFYLGGSYEFSENFLANFEVGPNYSRTDDGHSSLSPYAQISLNYTLGRSVFSLSYNTSIEDDFDAGKTVNQSSYAISWAKSFDRTQINLGFSYNTYDTQISYAQITDVEEESNTFVPYISFNHELTPRARIFASYNAVISEDKTIGDDTHTASYGLSYDLSEQSTLSLSHSFLYTMPHDEDDYYTNRVMIDLSYRF